MVQNQAEEEMKDDTYKVHLATSSKHGICPGNHGRVVMRVDGDEVMEEKAVATQHASCHQ